MYERLTRRDKKGVVYAPAGKPPSYVEFTGISADRLAAYEDSELSPEEVHELAKAKADERLVDLPCKVGESLYAIVNCADIIKSCDDDYFTGTGAISCPFEKDCPFEECDDGNRGVFETACKGFWVDDEGRLTVFLDYINANIGPLDFGKTVFLTREAAENALGGGEDGSSKDE